MKPLMIGIGSSNALLHIYIENIPPLPAYQQLKYLKTMQKGEVKMIADETGNHWRKIFNVYAKLVYELNPKHFSSWQQLRDNYLLQAHSEEALLFSAPTEIDTSKINIIMGKAYANKLGLLESAFWLNNFFAINENKNIIICPYFDYRQLSNIKIIQLVTLIKALMNNNDI